MNCPPLFNEINTLMYDSIMLQIRKFKEWNNIKGRLHKQQPNPKYFSPKKKQNYFSFYVDKNDVMDDKKKVKKV